MEKITDRKTDVIAMLDTHLAELKEMDTQIHNLHILADNLLVEAQNLAHYFTGNNN